MADNQAPQPPPQVCGLEDFLWVQVFGFVGDAVDFRSLELSCRVFHTMFQHDSIWVAAMPSSDDDDADEEQSSVEILYNRDDVERGTEHRYAAFLPILMRRIATWQETTHNIILDVLGSDWVSAVERGLNDSDTIRGIRVAKLDGHEPRHGIELRSDTIHVLACLVEEQLIYSLRKAQVCALQAVDRREGYSVLIEDVEAAIAGQESTGQVHSLLTAVTSTESSTSLRDSLCRRLAFRAGIPRYQDRLVATEIDHHLMALSFRLTLPGAIALASRPLVPPTAPIGSFYHPPKIALEPGQTIRDVAPHPRPQFDYNTSVAQVATWVHCLVPRLIEEAAARAHLRCTVVWGSEWWPSKAGCTPATERQKTYQMYTYPHSVGDDTATMVEQDAGAMIDWHYRLYPKEDDDDNYDHGDSEDCSYTSTMASEDAATDDEILDKTERMEVSEESECPGWSQCCLVYRGE